MHRNLDRRVEVLASITNPAHVAEIAELFELAFDKAPRPGSCNPDGTWIPYTVDADGEPLLDMQDYLINVKSRRRAGHEVRPHRCLPRDLGQHPGHGTADPCSPVARSCPGRIRSGAPRW